MTFTPLEDPVIHRSLTTVVPMVAGVLLSSAMLPSPGASQSMDGHPTLKNSRAALDAFRNPPAWYRSATFWVWNDLMTERAVDEGLADLKAHGIGGVFIHPRPGLITPYLSGEWLTLCRRAVTTGKKLGMKVWLYDENSYPSGFAGGHVPQKIPDAGRAGLKMTRANLLPKWFESPPLLVLAKDSSGWTDITGRLGTESFGSGEFRIFHVIHEEPRAWHGGFTYVDLLRPEVTRTFLDITLGAYKSVIGKEFGKTVPGIFQDEAEIRPAAEKHSLVVNYTPALFDRFRQKWGYDLIPVLPSLFEQSGDWRRIRHDFYATTLQMFIDGWAKQYYDSCTANNLRLTGHYWEHLAFRPETNPDNMATLAYSHVPGIDVLMNEYTPSGTAQFGNARIVREIRSIANQLGRERTLSETFGAGGWEMSFADQKRIADWEYALGVNLINQHLTYVTIKGMRKRDHPLSFSYHEPWWKHYGALAGYFGRLSVALCAGEQRNRILVLEPTTTGWMYATPTRKSTILDSLSNVFHDFINTLEAGQIEYDLGSEDILKNHGSVSGSHLTVGQRTYDLVILPPGMENLEEKTVTLLQHTISGGGNVLCCGDAPRYVGGKETDLVRNLAAGEHRGWLQTESAKAMEQIHALSPSPLLFRTSAGIPSPFPLLFHHRRVLEDGELLFLANTGNDSCSGEIVAAGRSCDRWDPFTGSIEYYPSVVEGERITFSYSLPPAGSLLLHLRPTAQRPPVANATPAVWTDHPSRDSMLIRRLEPNVLTLDYCDLTLGDSTEGDLYFYTAQQKAFQHHGFEKNPWDGAVQFRTSILDRDTFPPGTGFTASFHFTVDRGVKSRSLRAVVERPGVFRVAINGKQVKPLPGTWWLDRAFGVYDIGRSVTSGENTITVTSSPFTVHSELEAIYLLGDFSLEVAEKGFHIVPAREMRQGAWNTQGSPFYPNGVSYTKEFEVDASSVQSERFVARLGKWSGVVASVSVNGSDAGLIAFAPYELDVTRLLKPGRNRISVTVLGSLKNTLGPHHGNPPLGRAWPAQFQTAPQNLPAGSEYSTVGYGLFEDFALRSTPRQIPSPTGPQ